MAKQDTRRSKAAAKRRSEKQARFKREGTSHYARKKAWRDSRLGGPIPTVYPGVVSWHEAQQLFAAGVGVDA